MSSVLILFSFRLRIVEPDLCWFSIWLHRAFHFLTRLLPKQSDFIFSWVSDWCCHVLVCVMVPLVRWSWLQDRWDASCTHQWPSLFAYFAWTVSLLWLLILLNNAQLMLRVLNFNFLWKFLLNSELWEGRSADSLGVGSWTHREDVLAMLNGTFWRGGVSHGWSCQSLTNLHLWSVV